MTIRFPSIRAFAMSLLIALPAAGCTSLENTFLPSQLQSDRTAPSAAPLSPSEKNDFKAAWMGKTFDDVEQRFGRPSQSESLEDTGGRRYYYREPGQPHYVFEFGPRGKVTAAAIVD